MLETEDWETQTCIEILAIPSRFCQDKTIPTSFRLQIGIEERKKKIIIRNLHNLIMRNCDQLMFGLSQLDVTGEQTREQNKEQCFVSTRNNNNNNKSMTHWPLE